MKNQTQRILIALACLVLASTAQAQNATTGAVQGVVKNSANGSGLDGVTVVAKSDALQGTQTTSTRGGGRYKISNLPPGTYELTYFFNNEPVIRRKNIRVNINATAPVYVKFDPNATTGEVITIVRAAPAIDTADTKLVTRVTSDMLQKIPTPGANFEDALGVAPGSTGDAVGVSFSGSTSVENNYVVDGVNSTGLAYGTVGAPVINDFIEEIEIITGGYNAEYGRATGGDRQRCDQEWLQ